MANPSDNARFLRLLAQGPGMPPETSDAERAAAQAERATAVQEAISDTGPGNWQDAFHELHASSAAAPVAGFAPPEPDRPRPRAATAKKRCSSANALHAAAIEAMLARGEITTPDEFTALCRTVFRNAFVYNKPGQPDGVRECAEKLSLVFEKELAKM